MSDKGGRGEHPIGVRWKRWWWHRKRKDKRKVCKAYNEDINLK